MNNEMKNLPDDVREDDPRAPWNTPDECSLCEGTGRVPDPMTRTLKPNGEPDSCQEDMVCPMCDADRDDPDALKTDHDYDQAKNGE